MTDNVNEALEDKQTENIQPTAVELQALDAGWVPKDEFNGEDHKWVDAGEFLRRGELFKKIEDQSKQLKDVKSALAEMKKLHSQVREVEYKRALDTIKAQKKAALEDGDADAVIAADERIDLIKEQQRQLQSEPADVQDSGAEHPEFVAWTEQNSWYKSSAPMKAFADALGADLARAGNSPSEVLRKVATEVRKEFPNRFKNQNQERVGNVESGRGSGTGSAMKFVLTDDERQVMNKLVRQKVLTEKEYIESIKKVRG
jgi:vacuolar-type H+-ATPase subunit I/STV1